MTIYTINGYKPFLQSFQSEVQQETESKSKKWIGCNFKFDVHAIFCILASWTHLAKEGLLYAWSSYSSRALLYHLKLGMKGPRLASHRDSFFREIEKLEKNGKNLTIDEI